MINATIFRFANIYVDIVLIKGAVTKFIKATLKGEDIEILETEVLQEISCMLMIGK